MDQHTIKGVLFDLDGTLSDTIGDITAAVNKAAETLGLPLWTEKECCYLVGDGVYTLSSRAVRERQDLKEDFRQIYQSWYETHNLIRTRPYDGIPELLSLLKKKGLKVSVFTNKPQPDALHILEFLFPGFDFDVIRGQLPDVPVKPAPDGALAVASALGLAPAEIAYLGDTNTDMYCAVASGMIPFGVLWGFRDAPELTASGARYLLKDPLDFVRYL